MLAPALFSDFAAAEQPQLFCQMPSLAAKLARSSPGPSCSNNDSHDVTGIAPSSLTANGMASKRQLHADTGPSMPQASDDCQCSADSMHMHSASRNTSPLKDHQVHTKHVAVPASPAMQTCEPEDAFESAEDKGLASANKRPRPNDLKKARMIWSEELHSMFLRALSDIGLRHAVPKTIMQRMGVDSLSRENVASHLQKYRLALKRKAGLPDNTLMTTASWRQLEQAHEDCVASIPTATAAAPLMARAAGPAPLSATPAAMLPPRTEPQASPKQAPIATPAPKSLPPLPPLAAQKMPPHTFPGAVPCAPSGLPPGFTVPPPDSDGVAVGIPMPSPLFASVKDSHGMQRSSHSSTTGRPTRGTLPGLPSSDTPPPTTGPSDPPLRPLGMPDAATALMPPTYSYPATDGGADGGNGGGNKLCTVYMYNPSLCGAGAGMEPAQARTLVKPAQVPQMLLSVSAAAYNSMAGGAAVPELVGVAHGAPAQTGSTGSASRPVSGGDDDNTGVGKRRRRMSVRVRDFPGEQEASTRRPRSLRTSPAARALVAPRSPAQAPAPAAEVEWGGDCTALDMLAEIAGRLTEGQQ